jgi:hypothetical protein
MSVMRATLIAVRRGVLRVVAGVRVVSPRSRTRCRVDSPADLASHCREPMAGVSVAFGTRCSIGLASPPSGGRECGGRASPQADGASTERVHTHERGFADAPQVRPADTEVPCDRAPEHLVPQSAETTRCLVAIDQAGIIDHGTNLVLFAADGVVFVRSIVVPCHCW